MRRSLLALITPALAAAALSGCGEDGGTDPSRFLPRDDAAALESLVRQAQRANDRGDCDAATDAVADARARLDEVPETVSQRLTRNVDEWLVYLGRTIGDECGQEEEPSATPTRTAEPTETPDRTETTPTETPTPEETETPTATPSPSPEPTTSPSPTPDTGGATDEPGAEGDGEG